MFIGTAEKLRKYIKKFKKIPKGMEKMQFTPTLHKTTLRGADGKLKEERIYDEKGKIIKIKRWKE